MAYVVPLTHIDAAELDAAAVALAEALVAAELAVTCFAVTSVCSALASVTNVGKAASRASPRLANVAGVALSGAGGNTVIMSSPRWSVCSN